MRGKKRWIILVLIVVVVGAVVLARREPRIEAGSFLVVELGGRYTEARPSSPVGQLLSSQKKQFGDVLLELRKATVDPRLQGVLLKVTPVDLDFAKLQELRDTLHTLRTAGKRVIAWVSGEADSGNREYYVSSAADQVYFSQNTMLPLLGLKATFLFLGGVWENLDVEMQVEQIREYKTFGDFLARKQMSEPHREMANSLLDNLYEQFLRDIADSRHMSVQQIQTLIDAPTLTPEDYARAGLIDGIRYYDELLDELGDTPGAALRTVSMATYRRVKATSVGLMQGPKIAVVYGIGGVTTGKSGWNAMGQSMGAETMVSAFQQAVQDETIRAIVFRIDSPGGSALASDLIWHAVKQAVEKKPVVVSMSGIAGSGGYYIAAAATKIVAQPATLTGSIGIVFSLPNIHGLLQKMGVGTETLWRGHYATLFDASKSWTPEERQQVQRILENLYRTFTRKVAEGRGLTLQAVDRIGRGRVWTGAQARELGLVDQLGGLDTALRLAKEASGIPAETGVQLVFFPRAKHLLETLLERFRAQMGAKIKLPAALKSILPYIDGLTASEPRALMVMPFFVRIR